MAGVDRAGRGTRKWGEDYVKYKLNCVFRTKLMSVSEVTVIVYSAENLTELKSEDQSLSCIIGLGGTKFITSAVAANQGSFLWNETSIFPAGKSGPKPVKLKLVANKHRVAKASIQWDQIASSKPANYVPLTLRSYSKPSRALGKILVRCWASQVEQAPRDSSVRTLRSSWLRPKSKPSRNDSVECRGSPPLVPQVLYVEPRMIDPTKPNEVNICGRNLGPADVVNVEVGSQSVLKHTSLKSSALMVLSLPPNFLTPGKTEVIVTTKRGGRGNCVALVNIAAPQATGANHKPRSPKSRVSKSGNERPNNGGNPELTLPGIAEHASRAVLQIGCL